MAKPLSHYLDNRDNNFNLLRFLAASLVLYSHSYPLSGHYGEPLSKLCNFSFGDLAVDIFFITSGLLVTNSLFHRKDILGFISSRLLRIYPALLVAVLFCVFIVGTHFTTMSLDEYLSHPKTWQFLRHNSHLLGEVMYHLPGVFADIPWKDAVNGSLWTLPNELKMYQILMVAGILVYIKPGLLSERSLKIAILCFAAVSLGWLLVEHALTYPSSATAVPNDINRFVSMFFIGAACYVCSQHVVLSTRLFILVCLIFAHFIGSTPQFFVLYHLLIAYLVLYIAFVPAGIIRKYNQFGDYSYGMYIYAFPVQQSVAASIPEVTFLQMISYAFIGTLILAILSWHLIEKPMLAKKDRVADFVSRYVIKL